MSLYRKVWELLQVAQSSTSCSTSASQPSSCVTLCSFSSPLSCSRSCYLAHFLVVVLLMHLMSQKYVTKKVLLQTSVDPGKVARSSRQTVTEDRIWNAIGLFSHYCLVWDAIRVDAVTFWTFEKGSLCHIGLCCARRALCKEWLMPYLVFCVTKWSKQDVRACTWKKIGTESLARLAVSIC